MHLLITLLVLVIGAAIGFWLISKLPLDARAMQLVQIIFVAMCLILLVGVLTGYMPALRVGDGPTVVERMVL